MPADAFDNELARQGITTSDVKDDAPKNPDTMRGTYRQLSEAEKANMAAIKRAGRDFHDLVDQFPNSREISLAKTKIEEAVMWAVKAITG